MGVSLETKQICSSRSCYLPTHDPLGGFILTKYQRQKTSLGWQLIEQFISINGAALWSLFPVYTSKKCFDVMSRPPSQALALSSGAWLWWGATSASITCHCCPSEGQNTARIRVLKTSLILTKMCSMQQVCLFSKVVSQQQSLPGLQQTVNSSVCFAVKCIWCKSGPWESASVWNDSYYFLFLVSKKTENDHREIKNQNTKLPKDKQINKKTQTGDKKLQVAKNKSKTTTKQM